MAVDTNMIRAYEDGAVYTHAPGATVTLPTDASTAPGVGWFEIGAIGPEGLTEATSQSINNYYIWQRGALGRTTRTESVKTFTFAAAETTMNTLGLQYPGSSVTSTTEGATVEEKPPTSDRRAWILHGKDGDDRAQRVVLPIAEIGERGDVVWSGEGPTVYEWTLNAYVDSSGNWTYRYYLDEDMATP
jgi:hypothetical protein